MEIEAGNFLEVDAKNFAALSHSLSNRQTPLPACLLADFHVSVSELSVTMLTIEFKANA
jgi:hypothetical protein